MLIFEFKKKAAGDIDRLPNQIRRRILEKLKFYSFQENPLRFDLRKSDFLRFPKVPISTIEVEPHKKYGKK